MKIVVIGSGGRLGAALCREWSAAGDEVVGFNHASLDIGDTDALYSTLQPLEFDVLVNCAAQTNVDRCEAEVEEAFRLNGNAPIDLGDICYGKGARFIHISTDYVFDGAKNSPYTEEDEAKPISVYGHSKKAGEDGALTTTHGQALVARVSWVFGPDRPSFIDGVLTRAREHEQVEAIADKRAVPTYTADIAALLRPFLGDNKEGGLLHLCNSGECSWQEYGQYAIDCALAAGVEMKGRTVAPLAMADLKSFVAKRPPYTVMATEKLTRLVGSAPRSWQAAVEDYVRSSWAPRLGRG
ncbi:MAG TPA: dTDP-4-dehydrorhamnose reductase [Chthoniobacteraceae bacterium]|jgi:dTDP-4-dehydrorhamnose reductase